MDHEGSLPLRILTFSALLLFCGGHWIGFVAEAPEGRLLLIVLIAAVSGSGLALTGLVPGGLPARVAARLGLVVAALAAGLLAIGLDDRYLLDWSALAANVDGGLAGTTSANWPYAGDDAWLRLTVLLALPAVATLATALAFWPARRGAGILRSAALVLVVALYSLAVTERGLGDPIGRGLVLLILVAAWLWLPRLRARDATTAAAALLAAGAVALPVAAGLSEREGWFDYENWSLFGDDARGPGATFDWSHSYGPIDWPRDGKTLLRVRAARPHYWKAQTLDYFDGLRWAHSNVTQSQVARAELPHERNRAWDERLSFRVDGLSSRLVVAAGTVYYVRGDALTSESGDGTITIVDDDLERGDAYEVFSYVPRPSPRQMRAAPARWPAEIGYYTAFELPRANERQGQGQVVPNRERVVAAEPGTPLGDDPATRARIEASPYRRTYELARRLAAGQATTYDVVRRIEEHFERGFTYTERPPRRAVPLDGFLFRDRAGYCQQFSGAMALLLRMNGIPARVAAGFSPGVRDPKTREFRVRDLDAHSWVEVYFTGIGWVAFDPTPSQAPASAQESDSRERRAAATGSGGGDAAGGGDQGGDSAGGGAGAGDDGRSVPWRAAAVIALVPIALLAGLWLTALLRARRVRAAGGDPDLRELVWALDRLGHPVAEGTTLLELEGRLAGIAGPGAARHVRSLRERRYAPPGVRHATGLDRRALRRGLARGRGPLARLRALMALPPRRPTLGRG
ncbi:MAG TPA: transglutaminase domain-containing protein [Thermoleophilaceae bacterium]